MLRATRPGDDRRNDLSSCSVRLLRPAGPSEAGPRPAMQPLGSLREAQGGTQAAVCEGEQSESTSRMSKTRESIIENQLHVERIS
eukprot:scaffold7855_cov29-Phaeocystis_antarctica.AAC.1